MVSLPFYLQAANDLQKATTEWSHSNLQKGFTALLAYLLKKKKKRLPRNNI